MKRAARLQRIPAYPFAQWAKQVQAVRQRGLDIIHLDVGNPDLPPPDTAVESLYESARKPDHHGYAGYQGLPSLREAIAAYYERRFGVKVDPDNEVLPLIGSKEGIVMIALACLDPGDLVLIPDPGYAPYTGGAMLAGAEIHTFPLLQGNNFLPDFGAIPPDIADKAVLMWLNYPNNPTGGTADLAFFEQAVDFAYRHDLLLCHDAPYCDITYDDYVAPSLLQVPGAREIAVEFNSLSKTANMAGWRVGMAVGNEDALLALAQIKANVDSGLFHAMQEATIHALQVDPLWTLARNLIYQERLKLIVDGLEAVGMAAQPPHATPYLWVKVPSGWGSVQFAQALLEETGVALAPGTFFGPSGEGYIRFSATEQTERVAEAMVRLREFMA